MHSEAAVGPYLLTLDLPKTIWAAGEPITGEARLKLTQGTSVELGGSGGGLIGFSYLEVGGLNREMDGVMTSDCAPHLLTASAPLSTGLKPGGSYSPGEPNASFYREFMTAPFVALPAGTWAISAYTSFVEGQSCQGQSFGFQTSVQVTITPSD